MRFQVIYYVFVSVVAVGLGSSGTLSWAACGDLDNSGAVVATDALLALRRAVGQSVTLVCPLGETGQTTVFGPGSDGDVRAGAPLSYTDNGDGTITDNNTGLMWEKKDDSGGIHDKDNTYTWTAGGNNMDGTMVTVFLDTLNDVAGGGANCFAGHCDWRIPNLRELLSIVHYGALSPSVDPAFHQAATCTGCTDVTLASCSCTASSFYWPSSTTGFNPGKVWEVGFGNGGMSNDFKGFPNPVRAVRG